MNYQPSLVWSVRKTFMRSRKLEPEMATKAPNQNGLKSFAYRI